MRGWQTLLPWNDPALSLILHGCINSESILDLHLEMEQGWLLLKALVAQPGRGEVHSGHGKIVQVMEKAF